VIIFALQLVLGWIAISTGLLVGLTVAAEFSDWRNRRAQNEIEEYRERWLQLVRDEADNDVAL
jgi:hypothetical protein